MVVEPAEVTTLRELPVWSPPLLKMSHVSGYLSLFIKIYPLSRFRSLEPEIANHKADTQTINTPAKLPKARP